MDKLMTKFLRFHIDPDKFDEPVITICDRSTASCVHLGVEEAPEVIDWLAQAAGYYPTRKCGECSGQMVYRAYREYRGEPDSYEWICLRCEADTIRRTAYRILRCAPEGRT